MMRFLGALFYKFIQFFGWFVRLTPHFLRNFIGAAGAILWLDIVGFRRRTILLNLAYAFPRMPEESSAAFKQRIYALARNNVKNYFLGFFEILEKTTWSESVLKRKVEIHGLEHVHAATQNGRGVFLVTAHMGNWEVALALSNWVGKPLSVIVRYVRNSFWDEALMRSRKKFEINLLPENSSGVSAVRAYKKGHIVAFVMDQHTGEPHGVLARFFGVPAWTAKGLAILAPRLGATILPMFSYRKDGKVHVTFEAPLQLEDLGECREEAQLLEHVQRCNDKIEEWVRKFPEQYFWIHRRFKAAINYKEDKLPFPEN